MVTVKQFKYSTRYFHDSLFNNETCIIDNEIKNDISKDWNYEEGEPVVVGFLYKDSINIFLKEDDEDEAFVHTVQKHLKLMMTETDLYAFNRHMERGNFKGAWDIDVPIKEVKPFRGKGWNKDRFYNELLARQIIPDCKVADVFEGDASLCIFHYQKYIETGKIEYALSIIKHNINCLLKESVIQKHKDFFIKNYELDEKGWVME